MMETILHLPQRRPDADGSGGSPVEQRRAVVKTPKFPRKSADFASVTQKVFTAWNNYPKLTLLWLDIDEFKLMATQYGDAQGSRTSAGGARVATTKTLANLDKKATTALPFIKSYIREKWEDAADAQAQYARYGLKKSGNVYTLPRDRQQRLAALNLLEAAVAADGFGKEKYGTDFWTSLHTDYDAALTTANTEDSGVSTGANSKRNLRASLVKAMTALQYLLRANYPDDVVAKFREFGWQKEDY